MILFGSKLTIYGRLDTLVCCLDTYLIRRVFEYIDTYFNVLVSISTYWYLFQCIGIYFDVLIHISVD